MAVIDDINKLFCQVFDNSEMFKNAQLTSDIHEDVRDMICVHLPLLFKNLLGDSAQYYKIKGSVGTGRATKTPWIAIMDKEITDTTRCGVYIVFLLSSDYKSFYITLNQGTTVPGEFGPRLKKTDIERNSISIREALNEHLDCLKEDGNADVNDQRYKVGCIYYTRWNVENKEECMYLLNLYLDVYNRYKAIYKTDSKSIPVELRDDLTNLNPSEAPRIWVYAPDEAARKWQECLDEGVMLLGWDEMENFKVYETRQDIVERLREVYGNQENAFTNDSLAIWQFSREMSPGDIVYVKRGRTTILGRGVVQGDYSYDENRDEFKSSRAVEWTHIGEWEYPKTLPMKTLTRINDYKDMVECLENLFNPQVKLEQIPFNMASLIVKIRETGLIYQDNLIQRYVCSLMTKPFVILSGLAGSGKTKLALAIARVLSENIEQQLCVVPVGADWTNREPLLGYPNALKQGEYMQPECGALQIMMRALRNPFKPYFLVLDEMNLSYVERYFADFLSALESHQEIPLWERPEKCDSEVPARIALPQNLFIIGTINVDETTYMFSPKVLDRANVIEFKISDDEMEKFLSQNMNIRMEVADGMCANMGQDFIAKSINKDTNSSELAQKTLITFFKVLKQVNAEFGYRSATEIYRFIANAKTCAQGMTEEEILDAAIVQKLLPKLHGSRKKLEPALKALWGLCMKNGHTTEAITRENVQFAKFPEAADKIQRMMQTALENGFTSFAEA